MASAFEIADEARAGIADLLDRQLSPLGLAAMDALSPAPGQTILDVGCGSGKTLAQLAERVGADGRVIGVDIGARSLAVARARTAHLPQVTLLHEDVAAVQLPDASIDGVYSRFGVMYFDEPIAAFANLRRMIRRGGRISFVCWRAMAENELDFLPVRAAALDVAVDETPFSFERPDYIESVLAAAGFGSLNVRRFDTVVSCGDVDDTVEVLTKVGALGKILRETPALLAEAKPRVRSALVARRMGTPVELRAATWVATATVD